jgi:hypothetical protein
MRKQEQAALDLHQPTPYPVTKEERRQCPSGRELGVPPLTDPDRLAAYKDALANWNVTDYVQFELTEQAQRWIERELGYIKYREIGRLMYEYVASGGPIDEVRETRPEWADYEFHYDLRFTIHDKPVYIETRLHWRHPVVPDESWILVVNVHEP